MSNNDFAVCSCCNHKLGRTVSKSREDHQYVTQCPKCKRYMLITYHADGRKPDVKEVSKNYEISNEITSSV